MFSVSLQDRFLNLRFLTQTELLMSFKGIQDTLQITYKHFLYQHIPVSGPTEKIQAFIQFWKGSNSPPDKRSPWCTHYVKNVMSLLCSVRAQLCPALYDLMDCGLSGFSGHEISQARILEWVAISFCRGSSQPRDPTCVSWVSCTGRRVLYR